MDPSRQAPTFKDHAFLYKPESMERLKRAVDKALSDGTAYELELTAVRRDGTIMRCIARGHAEKDEKGSVQRLYGSLQEI